MSLEALVRIEIAAYRDKGGRRLRNPIAWMQGGSRVTDNGSTLWKDKRCLDTLRRVPVAWNRPWRRSFAG